MDTRGQVTIAVHNGDTVSQAHNNREPDVCAHEPHIDPNGIHETWLHTDLRDFYEVTFGAAQRTYDRKARACRRIGNYLDSLIRDAEAARAENEEIIERNKIHKEAGEKPEKLKVFKKPVYELIVGIYPKGDLELPERERRDALHLWLYGDGTPEHKSWEERNPGLKLVGAYYHADEPDAEPHLHLDYVPVAECSRGMTVQNSLEGALKRSGRVSDKVMCEDGKERLKMAETQFTDAERDGLQKICEEMGLEVIHPQRGKKSRHKSTAEKKRETKAAELEEKVEQLEERNRQLSEKAMELQATVDGLNGELETIERNAYTRGWNACAAKMREEHPRLQLEREMEKREAEKKTEEEKKRALRPNEATIDDILGSGR